MTTSEAQGGGWSGGRYFYAMTGVANVTGLQMKPKFHPKKS